MNMSAQVFTYQNTEFRINKVWDSQDITDPSAALALYIGQDLTIHTSTEDLERLFGVINYHLEQVHKARNAEKEAERYAEAMFDQMLSSQESLS